MIDDILGIDENFTRTADGWLSLIHPDDREKLWEHVFKHFIEEHNRIDIQFRLTRHNDGEVRWVHSLGELEYDEEGNPARMIATTQDITDRKQMEEALRESESRFSTVFNQTPDIHMISSIEPDGSFKIIAVNEVQKQIMMESNLQIKDVVGFTLDEFLLDILGYDRTSYERTVGSYRQAATSGEVARYETINSTPTFGTVYTESTIAPIFDASNQCRYLLHILRDISERKQAEETLRESENRFSVVFNENADVQAIWSVEPDGQYRFVTSNNRFAEIARLGFNVLTEDVIDKTLDEVLLNRFGFTQTVYDYTLAFFKQAIQAGEPISYEENFPTPSGGLYLETTVAPIFGSSNVCRYILYSGHDISERKRAEETLKESESRFSVVFNQSADLQTLSKVESDGTFRFIAFNNRYLDRVGRESGVSAEDIVGKTIPEIACDVFGYDESVAEHNLNNYKYVVETGEVLRYEEVHLAPHGAFYAETTLTPIIGASNEYRYVLYSARDITERRRAEEEIRQLNEELEQRVKDRTQELERANEEIKHFAYIVSHDLRSPLVNLKGFSAELRADLDLVLSGIQDVLPLIEVNRREPILRAVEQDIPESLRFIESSVSNMDTFTKAILKLSRLGRLNLEAVAVDTKDLVSKILDGLNYQINQQNIKVTTGDLPVIHADLVSMEQIFANIITNAITYSASDRTGEITVGSRSMSLRFTVN